MKREMQLNNHKGYFSEEADVTLRFNLFDWLETEREKGWDEDLFHGLAEYAIDYIVRECRGSYYSSNFNTNLGNLVRMILDAAREDGLLSEIADNHIKRLQDIADRAEANDRTHERAMGEIARFLHERNLWDERSAIISKYYTDKPLPDLKS